MADIARRLHRSTTSARLSALARATAVVVILCSIAAAVVYTQTTLSKDAQAGFQALEEGDADRAASAFYTGLTRTPKDPLLHLGAAVAARRLGRDRDAEVSLNRALELEPRLTPASELLGQLKYEQGEIDDAIRIYEQALKLTPGSESMRAKLNAWTKEASIHRRLTERRDGRFTIAFEGQADAALATHAATLLEAEFWRIGQTIGGYPSNRILVTFYSDQQFRDVTRAPEWIGGLFDGKIRLPVRGASQNLRDFDRVLIHELTHAIVFNLAPRGVPTWLHEGLGMYFERAEVAAAQRQLRAIGVVIPLFQIQGSFTRLNEVQAAVAYCESLIAADVLVRLVGSRMTTLLQALSAGQPFKQSLERVGTPFSSFESQYSQQLIGGQATAR